jgi:DNA-binding PadR family transcriptional regulator
MSGKERAALTEAMFYVLMSFLRREMCGIEITEFVEQKTRGRVRLGPGTLYTLLGKFQDEQLIEETQIEGRKRTYRLTDKGRETFQEELTRLQTCVLDGEEELS